MPNDPLEALNWAWHHWDSSWWIIGAIGVGIAWTRRRLSDWSRRNSLATSGSGAKPVTARPTAQPVAKPVAASAAYTAAPSYAAAGYTAQPAYAAPPPAPQRAPSARKLYREGDPPQRTVAPVARSVNVPATGTGPGSDRWTLADAFGDPAHARNAIIVAEVLGTPRGLR